MKRMHLLGAACVSLAAIDAAATTIVGVDVLSSLQRERVARLGASEAMRQSNGELMREMLVEPASPYSELESSPSFTNDVDWPEILESLPGKRLDTDEALSVLQWDLGMTRARPGIDVAPGDGFRDSFVAANAGKADVDPDIFWHMLDLTGFRHSTKAATYAVGMQVLRRQMLATGAGRRASLDIDADVFDRVMRANHADQLEAYDLRYLSTLVQHRLVHWYAGGQASTGLRELPVAFRVARVAAAYRDAQGFLAGSPCHADASPVSGVAGTDVDGDTRALCFVAATDRAVHRWYLDEYRRQATAVPEPEHHESGLFRIATIAGAIFPLLEVASLFEVVEAIVADDLVSAEGLTSAEAEVAAERADSLTCRFPE
jgi:hypothetical protein